MQRNWRDDAICQQIDQDVFFPERGQGLNEAKRICALCEVRQECLDEALEDERGIKRDYRFGVRGGMSPHARALMDKAAA
ncbi:WhiB family transcriptional regulator [Mycobacteroides abscessus]|uniref:WhiB family transcriptional regulator n=1 Tax=Mycobacteroides abscessus TaxID=36809 RepID=UPI0009290B75|nr:WhiB family transcriptional regulator [Mycobacteroides abscessus]SHW54241.1 WhiB2 [Mycobacteroides abscessus subsp. abscessus]SIA41112.1 WhiB2 [Mycobacteroides abscessus subsp. abscessus]SIM48868.1 WhiB2 [Mycobacteroides abscessus subsp. abscessus]SKR77409.1 WhiB2 [Mycobacteroides abscessus subsp. abscessus]SLC89441.1 WhiB2 [Mycobacteroides abscessus subsp. abscessus]